MVVTYNYRCGQLHPTRSESIKGSTENDAEKDGINDDCGEAMHFRENAKRCGYVIYTVSS